MNKRKWWFCVHRSDSNRRTLFFCERFQFHSTQQLAQPNPNLTALHDVCRRTRIQIEHHHRRTFDVVFARKRCVQLKIGEVSCPDERGQIVSETIMHDSLVALAPHLCRLYPFRSMQGAVLLIEKLTFHAIWIALHCERAV